MRIEDGYLILDPITKVKKITGTKIPVLVGLNRFSRPGDCLLDIFGIYKEKIDPYWLFRGDYAEKRVREYLQSQGCTITWWEKKDVDYDNFSDPAFGSFGGLIDIAITAPEREVVEVKSKNVKREERICQYGVPEEELQGEFYAYLSRCTHYRLIWTFFTDEQEQELKDEQAAQKEAFLATDLVFHEKRCTVDRAKLTRYCDQALSYVKLCYEAGRIPLADLSPEVLSHLTLEAQA